MKLSKSTPRLLRFGRYQHLHGFMHCHGSHPDKSKPLLILLNSGLLPSCGPHRIYIQIAEAMNLKQMDCLRLDLSGLGESKSRTDIQDELERMKMDILETIDHLQNNFNYPGFLLFGICSGADYGYAAALHDPRIEGLFCVESFAYKTADFKIRQFFSRIRPASILKFLYGKIHKKIFTQSNNHSSSLFYELRTFPDAELIQEQLNDLLDRGCSVTILNNKGSSHLMNSPQQWKSIFPRLVNHPEFKADYWGKVDHTFTSVIAQQALIEKVISWVNSKSQRTYRTLK